MFRKRTITRLFLAFLFYGETLMSLKKVTLASLILLGLTACGSSGGGSSDSTVNQNTSQTAEQQAQADKLAAEKAEAERLATEKAKEAEVASSQSALAKEELARLNKEKAEAEKLAAEAQAKAEQALKEKAEAEKLSAAAKTQLDNAIKNKTIAEKAAADAKIVLDNAVKAKAEAESLTAQAIEAKKQADETLKTIQEQIPAANSEKEKALAAQEQANQNLKEAQAQLIQATADKDAAIRAAAEAKATLADANKQKEEALRLATEANDAKKAAEAEKDNAMKLAQDAKIAAEQAKSEADAAKQEAERLAKEAQEAKIKAEEERLAAEKARQEKLASFIAIAKQAGLTDEEATQVAQDNLNGTLEQLPKAIEVFKAKKIAEEQARLQREIDSTKGFSENTYQQGFNHLNYSSSSSASNSCVNSVCTSWSGTTTTGKTLYNQKYSVVSGDYSARQRLLNGSWIDESSFSNIQVKGLKTQKDAIPNEGAATYSGKAFEGKTAGDLTYNVDFATRVGSGSVSGLPVGQVTLGEANINGTALSGKANSNGNYRLEFFGPNAEEIGGKMSLDGNNYGLAGTRGEIQK